MIVVKNDAKTPTEATKSGSFANFPELASNNQATAAFVSVLVFTLFLLPLALFYVNSLTITTSRMEELENTSNNLQKLMTKDKLRLRETLIPKRHVGPLIRRRKGKL